MIAVLKTIIIMTYKRLKKYNKTNESDLKKLEIYLSKINELHTDKRAKRDKLQN